MTLKDYIKVMENITLDKSALLAAYRAGNADQKEILEHLFGKDVFTPKWREITSYEKACEVLGIEPREFKEIGVRPQYMRMANAMQQLLVICEAINADGNWYDKDGWGYYPIFVLYGKQEMDELGEANCKSKGIHRLLAACAALNAEPAGVRCTSTGVRCERINSACGFPLCLNTKEKAEFVGNQFFELCCACYGVTPKID